MDLLFSIDARFLPGFEIVVASLCATTSHPGPLRVHVVDAGLPPAAWDAAAERLHQFDRRLAISPVPIDLRFLQSSGVASAAELAPYYHWMVALESLDADRVLVLDADLLCTTDIAPVFEHDTGGLPFAAVEDVLHRIAADCPDPQLRRRIGHLPYFNSGLVLVDVDQWRRGQFLGRTVDFVARHRSLDQTTFNSLAAGLVAPLDWRLNVTHEILGLVGPAPVEDRAWIGYVFHVWKQYKPWLALNYLNSGALWYALESVYRGSPPERCAFAPPGSDRARRRLRHPLVVAAIHRALGRAAVAGHWHAMFRRNPLPGQWEPRFLDQCRRFAEGWERMIAATEPLRRGTPR